MTLEALILRCETGEMLEADYEHHLAKDVLDELAQGTEEEKQAALFTDVRKLSDGIIEQYLTLDREDKLKMAHVYQEEECFKRIGVFYTSTRKRLRSVDINNLGPVGKNNLNLLLQISNYSKLIPVLENYLKFIERNNVKPSGASLGFYLSNHNLEGKKVKHKSIESMSSLSRHDFVNNQVLERKDNKSILKSLTYGVPEELEKRVEEAGTLLPVRIKILEDYVEYVEKIDFLTPMTSSLAYYLRNHNLDGKEVRGRESMSTLSTNDFASDKVLKKQDNKSIRESFTYGVHEQLKRKVEEAETLLPLRIKILKNYVQHIEASNYINPSSSSLARYLRIHNVKGEEFKAQSAKTMAALSTYDFKNGCGLKINQDNKSIREAFTYGIPEELKQRVIEAESLYPLRVKVLEDYVNYTETDEEILPSRSSLGYYLTNYNFEGKKVEGKESMILLAYWDSRTNKELKIKDKNSILESMTHGISAELKKKVEGARSLLPLRMKILRRYIKYIEKSDTENTNFCYYLRYHNVKGERVERNSKESMNTLSIYDFEKNQQSKGTDNKSIVDSFTHGIPDQELLAKVRQYNDL